MKKAILITLLTVTIILSTILVACTDYQAIYDDDDLIMKSKGYTASLKIEDKINGNISLKCDGMSGVYLIDSNFTVPQTRTFDVTLLTLQGRAKLVLENGAQIYVLGEGSMSGELSLEDIPEGTYKLKLVTNKAKISFDYTDVTKNNNSENTNESN